MHYLDAYRFPFSSPKWLQNVLIACVCVIVPLPGYLVLYGYLFEVIEALHHDRERTYPDFDFNRILPYLVRGAWPFLVQLVLGLPLMIVLGVMYAVIMAIGIAAGGDGGQPPAVLVVLVPIFFVSALLLIVLTALIAMPLTLRAGLSQDFKSAFSLDFLRDFLDRVWPQLVLTWLFSIVSGLLVQMAGALVCCIGLYPAGAVVWFAQLHLWYQLYELYLERGGTPIPLQPQT